MRVMLAILLAIFDLANPAAGTARIWSVNDVVRHAKELHGKEITIRGWLPNCRGRDCSLFNSKVDAEMFRDGSDQVVLLSIGHEPRFDAAVKEAVPAQIVLKARVNATCIHPDVTTDEKGNQVITICADRVDDLQPIELIRLQPAAGKSAKAGK
jgi:hypothetical protein